MNGRASRQVAVVLAAGALGLGWAGLPRAGDAAQDSSMAEAAGAFLDSLGQQTRGQAAITFDDPNRTDWHFVPRDRRGAKLKDLDDAHRIAAHALLRSALASRGYLKAVQIPSLELVLRRVESADPNYRDPERYWISVFGEPGAQGGWGWRFEGHHISLNFTSVGGEVAVTPMFYGSNPGEVRSGPESGLRVLWDEESIGRRLAESLNTAQRAEAVIESDVPADILLSPGVGVERLGEPRGLAFAAMRDDQRDLVHELLGVWAGNLAPDLCAAQLRRMREGGLEGVRFLWIGSTGPGDPHYYRLHGPAFVIEYDNTQNGANHIHTLWRDPARDFGADLLREHLERGH